MNISMLAAIPGIIMSHIQHEVIKVEKITAWNSKIILGLATQCISDRKAPVKDHTAFNLKWKPQANCSDVKLSAMASQITAVTIVYSTLCSGTDQTKHQSFATLAFLRGIHRWTVNSLHKGPVTRNMVPFDDVIMQKNHKSGWTHALEGQDRIGHDWQSRVTLKHVKLSPNACPIEYTIQNSESVDYTNATSYNHWIICCPWQIRMDLNVIYLFNTIDINYGMRCMSRYVLNTIITVTP